MKNLFVISLTAAILVGSTPAFAVHTYSVDKNAYAYNVKRLGVVVSEAMLPGKDGANINGPTVIKTPSWLKKAPGKYLMYFAHHTGEYIRFAYADKLTGPWTVSPVRILDVKSLKENGLKWGPDHVASPELWVDDKNKQIRMYFHTPITPAPKFDDPEYQKKILTQKQATFLALSTDGVNFKPNPRQMGDHYLRVWNDPAGGFWGFSRLGQLNYSHDGVWRFTKLSPGPIDKNPITFAQMRHPALLKTKDGALLFYSKIYDKPESILVTKIKMPSEDWTKWTAEKPQLVLTPEKDYEGVNLPLKPGTLGSSPTPERGLRDPYPFIDDDGKFYLFYTVQGEKGIALAELTQKGDAK